MVNQTKTAENLRKYISEFLGMTTREIQIAKAQGYTFPDLVKIKGHSMIGFQKFLKKKLQLETEYITMRNNNYHYKSAS